MGKINFFVLIWVSNPLVLPAEYAAAKMETINACILTTTWGDELRALFDAVKQSKMKGKWKEDPMKIYGDLTLNIQLARTVALDVFSVPAGEAPSERNF